MILILIINLLLTSLARLYHLQWPFFTLKNNQLKRNNFIQKFKNTKN